MMARVFLFLFAAGLQGFEAYVLIRGLKLPPRYAPYIIAAFVLFTLPLPYLLWLQAGARQPPPWALAWIVRPVFAWHFNWMTFLLFLGPVLLIGRIVNNFLDGDTVLFVLRGGVPGVIAAWAALSVYGLSQASNPPELVRVEVELPGLPPEEDGLRIAQVSDVHVGWWNSWEEAERAGRMAAQTRPDLLLITGDMVDHHVDYTYTFADSLKGVNPRLGSYAIIGNHDVYTGREAVASRMAERGFVMLRNEWADLSEKGSSLVLAGVDDSARNWTGQDPAVEKAREVVKTMPPDRPAILMIHRPPALSHFAGTTVGLVLSGHTHGGQFRLPFGGPGLADATFPYTQGTHEEGGLTIHVSKGVGTVGWPFRLFCPPDVTLIVLRSPRTAGQSGK